jgi:phage terminase small subunit
LAEPAGTNQTGNQCLSQYAYQGNKAMNETETLTAKQDSFCVHYTTIGAETFGNGTKSAIAAKYSEKGAYVRGSELLRNRKVIERIAELHKENMQRNMITVDKVLADLEHDKLMARNHHQYSVSKSCTELQGKYLAMFTDNVNTNAPEPVQMTPEEREDYRIAANLLLDRQMQRDYEKRQALANDAEKLLEQASGND